MSDRRAARSLAPMNKPDEPGAARSTTARRHATITTAAVTGGLAAAIALVAIPFAGSTESTVTGALLLGFAFGWALLAVLSTRFTEQPQRWAAVPAVAMALTAAGLLVVKPGSATINTLGWIWPPLLLALVAWMTVQARREPRSRTRAWLLYPVFAILALATAGGAYE